LVADLTSGDDARAEAAAKEFANSDESSLEALKGLLRSENPDHRWWATRALAACKHPNASTSLIDALQDPDPAVQQCAALGLRLNPNPNAAVFLMGLLSQQDRLLARLAGDALTALGETAITFLAEALKDPDPAVRSEAARAFALMENPKTVPHLFSVVEDPSAMVQHWVELGMERLGIGMAFFKP
jgi:HEAT repeat protein